MESNIERPKNCGECERFFPAPKELRELHFFDGWCPEFAGVHLHKDDVCHPNIGRKRKETVQK